MLVHRRSLPRNLSGFPNNLPAGTHLYTWEERGTVRVKCLAQEHNTMSLARARTRTARSGVERTNHEATAWKASTKNTYLASSFLFRPWLFKVLTSLLLFVPTLNDRQFKGNYLHVSSVTTDTQDHFWYCGRHRAVGLFVNRSGMFKSTFGFSYVLFVTVATLYHAYQ